jgi:hypothetical protein
LWAHLATVRRYSRIAVVEKRALAPLSINLIVKRRWALIGLDVMEFAAHGLRSAYAAARPPKQSLTLDDETAAAAFGGEAGARLQKVKLSRRLTL